MVRDDRVEDLCLLGCRLVKRNRLLKDSGATAFGVQQSKNSV